MLVGYPQFKVPLELIAAMGIIMSE